MDADHQTGQFPVTNPASTKHSPGVRDYLWAGLAVGVGLFFGLDVVLCTIALFVKRDPAFLLSIIVPGLFGYWVAMGAWRRTTWGRSSLRQSRRLAKS